MKLNTIKPAAGAKTVKLRVGRGVGSGLGKTAGRGHKGQHARKGGYHKLGFEGGQTPIHRRLPKRGFTSLTKSQTDEVRLSELDKMKIDVIDLAALKAAGIVAPGVLTVKVIKTGELTRKLTLKGIAVTKGAREAIVAAGGSIEE